MCVFCSNSQHHIISFSPSPRLTSSILHIIISPIARIANKDIVVKLETQNYVVHDKQWPFVRSQS